MPLRSLLCLSLLALSLPPASSAQPAGGKKYALLVGVAEYSSAHFPPLQYAEKDVEELAKLLRQPAAGFASVRILTTARGEKDRAATPTAANVRRALRELAEGKTRHDTVLLALAGHGVQLEVADPDDKGPPRTYSYFCPADASKSGASYSTGKSERLINLKAEVFKALSDCDAGTRLFLMDACRNELTADATARSLDLARMDIPVGVAGMFSCSAGEKAFESRKLGHGVFFHFVLEGLRGKAKNDRGEVTWKRLEEFVSERVTEDIGGIVGGGARQTPLVVGSLRGKSPVLVGPGGGAGRRPADEVVRAKETSREGGAAPGGREKPGTEGVVKGGKAFTNSIGMRLVPIPAGTFTMGSPADEKDREDSEGPQHEVEVSEFYLGVHEVTVGQFRAFANAAGYRTEAEKGGGATGFTRGKWQQDPGRNWKNPGFAQGEEHPVTCVSWNDARAFCDWLNKQPDKKRPAGWAYRLPREAEWEYACRAGARDYQVFHFGTSLAARQANFDGRRPYGEAAKGACLGRTAQVGSYKENAFGLHDMHGNVWEWCADWFGKDYYKLSPRRDPAGPPGGSGRVVRGGGWSYFGGGCRSAFRGTSAQGYRADDLGIRVALVPSGRAKVPE
jgi:formylglycine-generating enzyme required for sulfatase activity